MAVVWVTIFANHKRCKRTQSVTFAQGGLTVHSVAYVNLLAVTLIVR